MDRLTYRDTKKPNIVYFKDDDVVILRGAGGKFRNKKDMTAHYIHDRFVALDKCLARLAEYEDTGLAPTRAKDLAEAERDGRLHVLPVKAGDTIYRLNLDHDTKKFDIATSVVISLYYYPQKGWEVWVPHGRTLSMSDFNKTWFLTREEAERAINE